MARVRLFLVAMVLLVIVGTPNVVLAQTKGLEWSVTTIYGTDYRPGIWLPLRVTVTNNGTDRQVEVHVSNFSTTLDVPGGSQKATVLYVQLDQTTRVPVALYDGETKLDTATLEVNPNTEPIVATLLQQPLTKIRTHVLPAVLPTDLPNNPIGLQMLGGLVVDEQAWNELSPAQHSAVEQWVASGGTLIAVGSATDALPANLRPATTNGNATFDGAALARQLSYDQPADMLAGTLLTPDAASYALLLTGGNPLLVARPVGVGRVVASAVAPDNVALTAWRGLDRFWSVLVPAQNIAPWAGPFTSINSLRDGQIPIYLNNLPALDLPPLRSLLILLGVYVLLAGPFTYLILRRLDRMAWAWVSIPVLTLIFAVLAYGFGARQRGSDIIMNELAIIERSGDGTATVQGYVGIFSPIKDEYIVQAKPNTLLRPLLINAGGGLTGGQGAINAHYSNDPAEVRKLSINQWSMEMFAFQYSLNDAPAVKLDMTLEGDTIRGTVRNTSVVPMVDAALIIGGQAQKFGTLEPGQERAITLRMQNNINQTSISYLLYQSELDAGYQTTRGPSRDLLAKTQALDTALPSGYGPPSTNPVFVAFVQPELALLNLPDQRFTRSQRTMLVQYAALQFGAGEINLDSRWMQIHSASAVPPMVGQTDFCFTGQGSGVGITGRTGEIMIQLPAQMSSLQARELQFVPALDGLTDPSRLSYELFNWEASTWELVEYRAGFIKPPVVAPYYNNGQIRLRYSLPEGIDNGGGWWGCFSPGLVVKGSLE